MYIKISEQNAFYYSTEELLKDNPQVSFPKTIPDAVLSEYNVFPVLQVEQPAYDRFKQKLVEEIVFSENTWKQKWTFVDLSTEEQQVIEAEEADRIRKERNYKLASCDWTQSKDIPDSVSSLWSVYRQQLRDITYQTSFPISVVWPSPPNQPNGEINVTN